MTDCVYLALSTSCCSRDRRFPPRASCRTIPQRACSPTAKSTTGPAPEVAMVGPRRPRARQASTSGARKQSRGATRAPDHPGTHRRVNVDPAIEMLTGRDRIRHANPRRPRPGCIEEAESDERTSRIPVVVWSGRAGIRQPHLAQLGRGRLCPEIPRTVHYPEGRARAAATRTFWHRSLASSLSVSRPQCFAITRERVRNNLLDTVARRTTADHLLVAKLKARRRAFACW